jgi:hypothetical protein
LAEAEARRAKASADGYPIDGGEGVGVELEPEVRNDQVIRDMMKL